MQVKEQEAAENQICCLQALLAEARAELAQVVSTLAAVRAELDAAQHDAGSSGSASAAAVAGTSPQAQQQVDLAAAVERAVSLARGEAAAENARWRRDWVAQQALSAAQDHDQLVAVYRMDCAELQRQLSALQAELAGRLPGHPAAHTGAGEADDGGGASALCRTALGLRRGPPPLPPASRRLGSGGLSACASVPLADELLGASWAAAPGPSSTLLPSESGSSPSMPPPCLLELSTLSPLRTAASPSMPPAPDPSFSLLVETAADADVCSPPELFAALPASGGPLSDISNVSSPILGLTRGARQESAGKPASSSHRAVGSASAGQHNSSFTLSPVHMRPLVQECDAAAPWASPGACSPGGGAGSPVATVTLRILEELTKENVLQAVQRSGPTGLTACALSAMFSGVCMVNQQGWGP